MNPILIVWIILILVFILSRIRPFRFWLSSLIFEKWQHRESAQSKGEKIAQEVETWNNRYAKVECSLCGHHDLNREHRYEDDIMLLPAGKVIIPMPTSRRVNYYKCPKCHHEQDSLMPFYRYIYRSLSTEKIITDGSIDRYRYQFFPGWTFSLVFGLSFLLGAILITTTLVVLLAGSLF